MAIKEIEDLREFKKRSGWSDEKIAVKLGVATQTLRNWLKERNAPSEMAKKMIREFVIRID